MDPIANISVLLPVWLMEFASTESPETVLAPARLDMEAPNVRIVILVTMVPLVKTLVPSHVL